MSVEDENIALIAKLERAEKRIEAFEKSENSLRRERDSLESLVSNSLDCIVQSDAQGIITEINQSFVEMTGFEKKDIIGKTPNFLAPVVEGEYESVTGEKIILGKTFFDHQKDLLFDLFENGKISNQKASIQRKDGKLIPVEENIFLIYDKKGDMIASAAIIRDITRWVKTEQELKKHRDNLDELVKERTKELEESERQLREVNQRLVANDKELKSANEQLEASNQQLRASEISLVESERSFRRLVETMNEGLVVVDDTGEISYVNEKLCLMTGYAKDELEGSTIGAFFAKEDEKSEAVMKALLSEKGSDDTTSYEVVWIKKDKNKMSVIISPEPIIENENLVGNFAVITDITVIKEAERSVRESRDFLENIFKTTRDGIVVTDISGKIIRTNDSVERLFGFTRDELVGKDMRELMPESKDNRENRENFSRELNNKGFFDISETFFKKKNGEIAPFECNISLVTNSEEEVTAAVAMLRDITERKKMEQQFLRTEKLSSIGELAGGVAHDFNNVLSAILGRAQLLMQAIEKIKEDTDHEKLGGFKFEVQLL